MAENEIEFEGELTRDEIADQLERFVDTLRGGGPAELIVDDDIVTVDPPETVEYEVEVEDEGEIIGDDVERSVEIELEWKTREGEAELSTNQ